MLAYVFLPAFQLRLKERERDALIDILDRLERGEFVHLTQREARTSQAVGFAFNMQQYCGSVGCIAGWCDALHGTDFICAVNGDLEDLFHPPGGRRAHGRITPRQAGKALRNYLECGQANWEEVLTEEQQHGEGQVQEPVSG